MSARSATHRAITAEHARHPEEDADANLAGAGRRQTVVEKGTPGGATSLTVPGRKFVEPLLAPYDWVDANADLLDMVERNRTASGHAEFAAGEQELASLS